ncbi:MAG: sigma-70 family RNA polymerase sigma factor [Planctomycetes bacterium]|nr:sigma-70 family RNA polymerase sigma factor [Planctomycetota bacterium]MBI3845140.1 sigma-70 family RNA polymerase sigma factor [Planctomycetota bacterium]
MTPNRNTRSSLLLRLRSRGDDRAWREFDASYRDLILRYCRRRGLQVADAEDVRQDVLSKLSRALPNFEYDRSKGRFRDYLGRVVANAIHSRRAGERGVAPSTTVDDAADVADPDDALSAAWEEEWVQCHFRRALQSLRASTEEKTLAIFEAILAGESYAAVAARFGTSEAAARKIKERLRDRLREEVVRQLADEDLEV